METNRLTVLIGPQASGKSLLMQFLYYFRDVKQLAAERYSDKVEDNKWIEMSTDQLLYELRGTILGLFVSSSPGNVKYQNDKKTYSIRVQKKTFPTGIFRSDILSWKNEWSDSKDELQKSLETKSIFIPSERDMYSMFVERKMSVLYESFQSIQMRKFTDLLELIRSGKSSSSAYLVKALTKDVSNTIATLEKKALGGEMSFSAVSKDWLWLINKSDSFMFTGGLSSGQMSTWPFFTIAKEYAASRTDFDFYFEEPETHLHPKAQVEVVKTIAYLISRGHRFVITTHSPFILYVINNLIQAHMAYDGAPPEGEFSINPDHVAAYCLGDNPRSIVDEETKLLNLDEIDDVLDSIGKQFYDLLNRDVKKNG